MRIYIVSYYGIKLKPDTYYLSSFEKKIVSLRKHKNQYLVARASVCASFHTPINK